MALGLPLLLAGCASTAPAPAPGGAGAPVAVAWQAPLPHGGQVDQLQQWWSQFDDPLMLRLIESAQRASPTLARAASTLADAQAARVAGGAARLPALDATAGATRARAEASAPPGTSSSAGLQAAWELDLFGANRAAAEAAEARLGSSRASWHDARVSVAAEAAKTYVELRACEALAQQAGLDAASRAETFRLTQLATRAGLRAPATAELARASAAQGQMAAVQQQAQCELLVKSLVALTAQDEPGLRAALAAQPAGLPRPAELSVGTVPAEVLAQRPDLHAAAQDVVAASADSQQADARRWPRITLSGSIARTRDASGGASTDGTTWSIGPVTLTFPLFDGGTRRAQAQAAQVRYATATAVYASRLREAIREVEGALVALDSTARRGDSARIASDGYERSYQATAAGYQAGTASLFELEDARRSWVSAQAAWIELQRERIVAWITLYRSIGGGWSPATPSPDAPDAPDAHAART